MATPTKPTAKAAKAPAKAAAKSTKAAATKKAAPAAKTAAPAQKAAPAAKQAAPQPTRARVSAPPALAQKPQVRKAPPKRTGPLDKFLLGQVTALEEERVTYTRQVTIRPISTSTGFDARVMHLKVSWEPKKGEKPLEYETWSVLGNLR